MKYLILSIWCVITLAPPLCAQPADRAAFLKAKRWVASRVWAPNSLKLDIHPSVDYVEFQKQYLANKAVWDRAFLAVSKADKDLKAFTENGKQDLIADQCTITVSEYTPKDPATVRLEGHQDYIDLQISAGTVIWGVCKKDNATEAIAYNPEKDVAFYTSEKTRTFKQNASKPYIFLFFPNDLHIPSYAADRVTYEQPLKKVVVKIRVAPTGE